MNEFFDLVVSYIGEGRCDAVNTAVAVSFWVFGYKRKFNFGIGMNGFES